MLLCFGGGVLLFTTFLHLAPEVRQSVERHQYNGQLMSLGTLSMAELLFCIGFFLVYLVEETVHATLTSEPEASEDLLYRTVSVRRCNKQASTSPLSTTTISTTVTAPTSASKSSSWRVGRFKYTDDDKEELGITEAKNTSSGCSIAHRDREMDTKSNQVLPALFVRSTHSVESSNEAPANRTLDRRSRELTDKHFVVCKKVPILKQETSNKTDTSARGLLTVVALSFHAIFEGLAVGLEPSISSVLYLAAAIATHKLVIAFCVGMELYVAGASTKTVLGYLSVFSLVTPLGIGVGLALGHFKNDSENLGPTPTILQGMAAGTLLYVVFFEVLARERANDKSGLLQLLAIIVGFMLMLGLQLASELLPIFSFISIANHRPSTFFFFHQKYLSRLARCFHVFLPFNAQPIFALGPNRSCQVITKTFKASHPHEAFIAFHVTSQKVMETLRLPSDGQNLEGQRSRVHKSRITKRAEQKFPQWAQSNLRV